MADSKEVKQLNLSSEPVSISNPADLVAFATTLKQFIVNQNLYTEIQKRNYVNVEGWQFAGGVMGVLPLVTGLYRVETDGAEIRYRAEVELRQTSTDRVVGYGLAICSNLEGGRQKQDEYVIASMAQTRAIGKAYRNSFAWLIKLAGYETTPAEEANGAVGANLEPDVQTKIAAAKDGGELEKIMAELKPEEKKTAMPLVQARLTELAGDGDVTTN